MDGWTRRLKINKDNSDKLRGELEPGKDPKFIDILLVEDNAGDARLVQKAFELGRIANRIFVVGDGIEALKFLRGEGEFANSPRPDLIVLDLNMPRMDGREALGQIKADPSIRSIPVIVMTSSDDRWDIDKSYDLQVSCYIQKPVQVREFLDVIKAIDYFWIGLVALPKKL